MLPMLTTAVKAARRAGNILNRGARDLDLLTITAKGPKDFVSEIDRAAQAAIVETVTPSTDHVLAEGTGRGAERRPSTRGSSDRSTADELPARLPGYCVSSRSSTRCDHAGRHLRRPQRSFHGDARRARDSSNRRIRVSRPAHLRECLIGTGFPFRDGGYLDTYLQMMKTMINRRWPAQARCSRTRPRARRRGVL